MAHADWSGSPAKRWVVRASLRSGGRYRADLPAPAGDPGSLIPRLARGRRLVLGLDLPVGVPEAWAKRAGTDDFLRLLPDLGHGRWASFFVPAAGAGEIRIERPFYPARPGGACRAHLIDGLGLRTAADLHRRSDLAHPGRPAAGALFWTLGPKQVGKAAISAWRDLLQPASRTSDLALWPFAGEFEDLVANRRVVVAEVYPAELQGRLGVRLGRAGSGSKRRAADRAAAGPMLLAAAAALGLDLAPALRADIMGGFARGPAGEDRFDCVIGLLGMLAVLRGNVRADAPEDAVRRIEGWILGRPTG